MTVSDWMSAFLQFVAIAAALLVALRFGPNIAAKSEQRAGKEKLLRQIVGSWLLPAHPDYQSAIAWIPLDFKDHPNVLKARHQYLTYVTNETLNGTDDEQKNNHAQNLQARLIEAMAKAIDIPLTSDLLLEGRYVSLGFAFRDDLNVSSAQAIQRIALALEGHNELLVRVLASQSPNGT